MPNKYGDIRYDEYYRNQFNTTLSEANERNFMNWVSRLGKRTGRDVLKDLIDYDLRGYWVNGGYKNGPREPYPEEYKKPNHRTFSDRSIYHGMQSPYGVPYEGGSWDEEGNFIPSEMQRNVMGWR